MATNVVIKRNKNENNASLIKRFTRKVQSSGILPKVRSLRYASRDISPAVRKKKKLNSMKRRESIMTQIKLGKMPETPARFRRR